MTAPYRTATGGRIDRGTRYEFTFNGRTYTGHCGDTLASALLAHGVHKIAMSVKLGRPHGISAAWAEDRPVTSKAAKKSRGFMVLRPGRLPRIAEKPPHPMQFLDIATDRG